MASSFVEHQTLHKFIAEALEIVRGSAEVATKLQQLRAPYESLLSDQDWLPEEFKQASGNTTMGHGIASLLLYRSELQDLSLSTLVVAAGLATPIHNHLAWGLVGLYQGEQEEEEYEGHVHDVWNCRPPSDLKKTPGSQERRFLRSGPTVERYSSG